MSLHSCVVIYIGLISIMMHVFCYELMVFNLHYIFLLVPLVRNCYKEVSET